MPELEFSFLGGLEIGPEATPVAQLTRKGRAVLAYLALHPRHAQSREKLAALLWSRNPEAQARTNLRQTLSTLRRAFSTVNGGCLQTDGDVVSLDLGHVAVDVAAFETLAAQASPEPLERAVALYRGDLLDGFSVREEPFEDWLRAERERLRALAVTALEVLVTHYAAEPDLTRRAHHAARLLSLDPLREDIHRVLMQTYAAQGRFDAALRQYDICRDVLRRELDVAAEPATQALAQELRARRGRPEPPVRNGAAADGGPATAPPVDERPETLPLPDRPSVAVLPFANISGDEDQDYFADGITENIITGLTRFREIFVISLKSALALRDSGGHARTIGRRLGVAHVVEGAVRKAGDRVRVSAQLVDAASGHRLWAEQYDRQLDDIFAVQDAITTVIVATLAGRIEAAGRRRAAEKPARDLVAYDYLLRARQWMRHYRKDSELAARDCLARALELDPGYAAAYAALAYSHIHEYESPWCEATAAAIERAYGLAQQAVALDEVDGIAHRSLAYSAHYRDLTPLARREIDWAISLNPNDYSNLCVKAWILLFSGWPAEALVCLEDALRLNPLASDNCYLGIGCAEFGLGRYEAALETFGKMSSWDTLRFAGLAACHGELGQANEAHSAAARLVEAARAEFAGLPGDPMARWRGYVGCMFRFRHERDRRRFSEGLRKAGLRL